MNGFVFKRMGRLSRAVRPQLVVGVVVLACCYVGVGGRPAVVRAWHRVLTPSVVRPASAMPVISGGDPVGVASGVVAARAHDCSVVACLALTFDDGPNPATTPQILSILEQAHVPATFFVIGSRAVGTPDLLARMYHDGDEIGNHSWSHPDVATLPADQVTAQIELTQAAVMAAGVPAPTLFRPPYGDVNNLMRAEIPLAIAMWNVDPVDWHERNPGAIIAATLAAARPGRVVDLHDIYPQTVAALPGILASLQGKYQLVTFSQLFNLAPGQRGEFFGR
jgi:peptidoglycan/xylan/chitin deacetylase (PgdA/CDA1 family)